MTVRGRGIWGACLLVLTGCAAQGRGALPEPAQPPLPPLAERQDFTGLNRQGIANFLISDPAWQAWLSAIAASDAVNAAIVDSSMDDVPAGRLSAGLSFAKDRYRRATSYFLSPVMVLSSCLNLPSETAGAVRLPDGLIVRYSFLSSAVHHFANGASCLRSTGYVSEVDSARGLAIITAVTPDTIDWSQNFALYVLWNRPFAQISQNGSYSVSDLIALIGR